MDCPACGKPMKKTTWRITNNNKDGDAYKEYDSTTYHCELNDVWLVTELPKTK